MAEYTYYKDVVPMSVFEQVKWERDLAIEQLESYGVGLGEKAEVVHVIHGRWIMKGLDMGICSNCLRADEIDTSAKYCRYCGAEMSLEGKSC